MFTLKEDDAFGDKKDDKDGVQAEALWPFCGIGGARHSIWRPAWPPRARMPQWSHRQSAAQQRMGNFKPH